MPVRPALPVTLVPLVPLVPLVTRRRAAGLTRPAAQARPGRTSGGEAAVESRRAESFSDGVFAVAITVLVFNLLPIADKPVHHFSDLRAYWPEYVAYAG